MRGIIVEEMAKTYDPKVFEAELVERWMDAGAFRRSKGVGDCTVVIPPPNVTGVLHMGHAMDDTIQDTFVRFMRMRGLSTRWILGTDHAGIATQTKVDKKLKSEGISRLEIGREKFLEACQDWRREYGGIIVEQIKRMGCSIDFDDEKFTMSPEYAKAVRKVFCDWYHDGLIYRGKRIVNWCPSCCTAISDDEAEYHDETGHLWHLRYPLTEPVDGVEYIEVATTRPETMLGDTGIAVSPQDPDKAKFVGKTVMLPIVNREIPIFSDWHVDAGFGTGFVKVTPAHDPNDFAMGQTHNLPQINIFDEHAVVVDGYGEFSGMDRDECRAAVVKWFDEHGLLGEIDEHAHSVMHCYRCDSTLEPWLSEQWFVAVDKLKKRAVEVVKSGEVTFHPARWTDTYLTWMDNLKDWCISRQLWWGHRIPAWYCDDCSEITVSRGTPCKCEHCGSEHIRQDEDTLDTWFSSALWPFSTLGWPDETPELKHYFPTNTLVTAYDIIFFWVARMIFSSVEQMGTYPFDTIFIHGIVRDELGRKMSKSLGNGIDPLVVIDKYGADALRFTLVTGNSPGNDMRYSEKKVEASRNFGNKIWNAARYILMNLDGSEGPAKLPAAEDLAIEDKWILSKFNTLCKEVSENIDSYELGVALAKLYDFIWDLFCDWYIEISKIRLQEGGRGAETAKAVLIYCMDGMLKLLHPFMPFLTEEIWQSLPHEGDTIMLAPYPEYTDALDFSSEETEFERIMTAVRAIRARRSEMNVPPSKKSAVHFDTPFEETFRSGVVYIQRLASATEVTVGGDFDTEGAVNIVTADAQIYLPMNELVDLDAERERLTKELEKAQKDLAFFEKKLNNPGFVNNAPAAVVEKDRASAEKIKDKINLLEESLKNLA